MSSLVLEGRVIQPASCAPHERALLHERRLAATLREARAQLNPASVTVAARAEDLEPDEARARDEALDVLRPRAAIAARLRTVRVRRVDHVIDESQRVGRVSRAHERLGRGRARAAAVERAAAAL